VTPLSGIPYRIDEPARAVAAIKERLVKARTPHDDSPIFQLLDGVPRMEIDHAKTDVFRDRVEYSKRYKDRLSRARALGKEAGKKEMLAIRAELGDLQDRETGLIVDLYLSLRAVEAFEEMLALYREMPEPLQLTRLVREQYAMALNRLAKETPTYRNEAETILVDLIENQGPSSETNGLLGRIYKDQYDEAQQAGRAVVARGFLKKAIETYLQGFETDWRDAYPGVNAVNLMERLDPPDPRQAKILPVVRYAAERRVASSGGDYWDHATLLELAVLSRDQDAAATHLSDTLVHAKDPKQIEIFRPKTTARNLGLIADWRSARGEDQAWVRDIVKELESVAAEVKKGQASAGS
jgi:hypothetical protein